VAKDHYGTSQASCGSRSSQRAWGNVLCGVDQLNDRLIVRGLEGRSAGTAMQS
jgi:hypothetical protein